MMAVALPDELPGIEEEENVNEIAIPSEGNAENYYAIDHIIPNVHYGNIINNYQIISQPQSDDSGTTLGSSVSSTATTNDENIATFSDSNLLKEKLQYFYQKIALPPITWLNQTEDLAIDKFYITPELQLQSSKIEREDIFQQVDGRPPNRILIEAQPGYGKTSLATRLAYDWAMGENYMNRFKFAFFIPLKELAKKQIETAIQDIAERSGFPSRQKTVDILRNNEDQTLFILDGLTELSKCARFEILQILYKRKFNDVRIVVTSKTGVFRLDATEKSKLFGEIDTQNTFHDKRIMLLGIKSADAKRQLLSNLVSSDLLLECNGPMFPYSHMFDSPLVLCIIAFLFNSKDSVVDMSKWSSDDNIVLAHTQIFKQLFTCIIRHSYAKLKNPVEEQFDLFYIDPNRDNVLTKWSTFFGFNPEKYRLQTVQTNLYEFGKLALDQIGKANIKFDDSGLMQDVYSLGFVNRLEEESGLGTKYYYEPCHKSIVDFAAAFYIWFDFNLNDSNFSEECLKCVVKYCISICTEHGETSSLPLFVFFLFGLLQDACLNLFKQLITELMSKELFILEPLGLLDPIKLVTKVAHFIVNIKEQFSQLMK